MAQASPRGIAFGSTPPPKTLGRVEDREPSQNFCKIPKADALPPKADIVERDRHVRFVPQADIRNASGGSSTASSSLGLLPPGTSVGKFPKTPGTRASTIFRQAEGYRCDASLPAARASL